MFKSGGNYKRSPRKFLIIGSYRHCFVRIFADINDGTDFNIRIEIHDLFNKHFNKLIAAHRACERIVFNMRGERYLSGRMLLFQ